MNGAGRGVCRFESSAPPPSPHFLRVGSPLSAGPKDPASELSGVEGLCQRRGRAQRAGEQAPTGPGHISIPLSQVEKTCLRITSLRTGRPEN